KLDAGSWFDARFADERIPTWAEAVAFVGTAAGLYPELKTPALYRARDIDQTALFVESIKTLNLQSRPAGSLIVQSFDAQPLKDLTRLMPSLSRVFLIDNRDGQRWLNDSGLTEIATFATGIGPAKALIDGHPE